MPAPASPAAALRGPDLVPTASLGAMRRAQNSVEDFVRSYFPYYGLGPADFLDAWHVLVWVEATVYQIDEENEGLAARARDGGGGDAGALSGLESALLAGLRSIDPASLPLWGRARGAAPRDPAGAAPRDPAGAAPRDPAGAAPRDPAGAAPRDPAGAARAVSLGDRDEDLVGGLLTPGVLGALRDGWRYWGLERDLCARLARPGAPVALADVHLAGRLKSFDYRVMHHVLRALLGLPAPAGGPDAALLRFLELDEALVDLHDDLVDYEDDVEANSFNTLRCYVRAHGGGAAGALAARVSELEARHAEALAGVAGVQRLRYIRRKHEAAGGDAGALEWKVPRLILDEAAFLRGLAGGGGAGGAGGAAAG